MRNPFLLSKEKTKMASFDSVSYIPWQRLGFVVKKQVLKAVPAIL